MYFFSILKKSFNDMNLFGNKVMFACFLAIFSIVLGLLFPSIFLAYVIFSFVCIGVADYTLSLYSKNEKGFESIFSNYKNLIVSFCAKTVCLFSVFLWSLVLIIPGIIEALNLSFVSLVIADENLDVISSINLSKKYAKDVRGNLLLVYLFATLLFIVSLCSGFGVALLIDYFISIELWLKLFIAFALSFLPFVLFICPFTKICITNLYLMQKQNYAPKKQKSVGGKTKS